MDSLLSERLKLVMDGPPKVGGTALADACGVKPPSVSDWLSGKSKTMEGSNLVTAAEFLKVRAKWLATGRGPMRDDDPIAPKTEKETTNAPKATLKDWRMHASPRSVQVIDRLTMLAEKDALREEDWTLIDQLAKRLKQAS